MQIRFFDSLAFLWLKKEEIDLLPKDETDLRIARLTVNSINHDETTWALCHAVINRKSGYVYYPFEETTNLSDREIDLLPSYGNLCVKVFFTNFIMIPFRAAMKPIQAIYDNGQLFIQDLRERNAVLAVLSFTSFLIDGYIAALKTLYYGLGMSLAALDGILFNPVRGFHAIELLERKYEPVRMQVGFSNIDQKLIHLGKLDSCCDPKHPTLSDVQRFIPHDDDFEIKTKEPSDLFPLFPYLLHQLQRLLETLKEKSLDTAHSVRCYIATRWPSTDQRSVELV